ncbi:MAG: 2-hydroxyacid dehydrogenase [Verrucomicrobiota bacterium]
MSENHVLILSPMPRELTSQLEAAYTAHKHYAAEDKAAFMAPIADKIEGIAVTGGFPVPNELLASMPNLKIIAIRGVGYDSVDIEYAKQRGIRVTNTPDVLNDEVADTAILLMLAAFRQLPASERYLREGRWLDGPFPLTRKFSGTRLGLVGMGRIGRVIAKRAEAFDCEIAYHSRNQRNDVDYPYYADLCELARNVDTLCVITPGGAETKHLINKDVLEALGPNGVLVNVARGSVVDEPALIDALESGAIAGAGLDVFEDEPNVPDRLVALDHVVLAPHVGSATHETRLAMGNLVADNLAAFFAGQELLTPVV